MSAAGGVDSPATTAAIALALHRHRDDGQSHYDPFRERTYRVCLCSHRSRNFQEHEEHVAAAVLEALELAPEWTVESKWGAEDHNVSDFYATPAGIAEWRNRNGIPAKVMRRLVSPWQEEQK